MLLGAIIALQQTDLKRILAYSTVSALGTLVMLLGIGSKTAVEAAMIFLVVHSLYKGTLFLVAGIIDYQTGTRDVTQTGRTGAGAAANGRGYPPGRAFDGRAAPSAWFPEQRVGLRSNPGPGRLRHCINRRGFTGQWHYGGRGRFFVPEAVYRPARTNAAPSRPAKQTAALWLGQLCWAGWVCC
jgi:hypothetical protein